MKRGKILAMQGMAVVLVALVAACSFFVPGFLSLDNVKSLGLLIATVGMVSCTMLFCLAGGDFDLSVGSTLALGGVLGVMVMNASGSILIGVVAALAAGCVVGLLNGFVIAKLGINALITTLATMQIVRGATNMLSKGSPVTLKVEPFSNLGTYQLFGVVPMPILIMLVVFALFAFLLNRTVFGRDSLAIGGNPDAARLAGIPIVHRKLAIFAMSGAMSALAGLVTSARMFNASNNAGDKLELQAISACVLGGVSLAGGVGTVSGVFVGVLIMGIVQNAMSLKGLDSFVQMVVTGAILLLAVTLDKLKTRAVGK